MIEEAANNEFDISEDEVRYLINLAKEVIRIFLKSDSLSGNDIIGLGKALYAFERLPKNTVNVSVEFGISYKAGSEDYNETIWVTFHISEESFGVYEGGWSYDKKIGGDSLPSTNIKVELEGFVDGDLSYSFLNYLEDYVTECLNLGAKVDVNDLIEEFDPN